MNKSNFDKCNMDNYVENILAENLTLKRKLDSKCEALLILNKELAECVTEKDQYKLMAEQLQKKLSSMKKLPVKHGYFTENQEEYFSNFQDSKDSNRNLTFEIESLRQKLRDALGDIKALRSKLNQPRSLNENPEALIKQMDKEEKLLKQLEAMNIIKNQLEMDLQSVLDEKEELVTERDAYKCKIHRLNHEFNMLLKTENHNVIDIDSLVMENRYLQEHLLQVQEEVKLANQTISRYKEMLEKGHIKGSVKVGIDNIPEAILSRKQVQDLLQITSTDCSYGNSVTAADLKSICLVLLENLNDKTLALAHQKKTNRILASRIYELGQKIESIQGSRNSMFPSNLLLEGYAGSEIDDNNTVNISEEHRKKFHHATEKSDNSETVKNEVS